MTNVNKNNMDFRISPQEFRRFTDEFKTESDRAAVILGTAQLDILLYQLLGGFLLPNPGSRDELLDGDSPLSTFSSRISMCYRLGLIDAEFSKALNLIRKIRNSFAHEVSGVTFETGGHRDRVRELVAPFISSNSFRHLVSEYFEGSDKPADQFRAVVASLCLRLNGAIERVERIDYYSITSILPSDMSDEEYEEYESLKKEIDQTLENLNT